MKNNDRICVSVVVLTYNHARFIRQALDSILMQKTDFRFEILVGDDASSDGTQEILRDYQRRYPERFRLWLREQNLGCTHNSYELLVSAQGDYIAACEGDDYWTDPNKLQKQFDFLEAHPEYVGCAHDCLIVGADGEPLDRQRLRWVCRKRVYTLRDYKGLYLPGQASTLLRRNLYRTGQADCTIFRDAHPQIGDRTTALQYAAVGDFYHMPEQMSCYRRVVSGGSMTSNLFRQTTESMLDDYAYTRRLEAYARNVLHVDAGFESHKRDLFVSAVFHFLRKRDRAWGRIALQLLRENAHPLGCLLYLPAGVLKKIYYRFACLD